MDCERVKLLKTVGAIYLGIYMILPGCLCQVLSVFGVSIHGQSIPQNVCLVSAVEATFPCHCDHLDSKKGELTQKLDFDGTPESYILEFLPEESQIRLDYSGSRENVRSRAPPPPGLSLDRVFTGVYLV